MTRAPYYPDYQPKNERHFADMLRQFRLAPTKDDMEKMMLLWVMSETVAREDIVVAHGRVARERNFPQ